MEQNLKELDFKKFLERFDLSHDKTRAIIKEISGINRQILLRSHLPCKTEWNADGPQFNKWCYYEVIHLDNCFILARNDRHATREKALQIAEVRLICTHMMLAYLLLQFFKWPGLPIDSCTTRTVAFEPMKIRTFSSDRGEVQGGTTLWPVGLAYYSLNQNLEMSFSIGATSIDQQNLWVESFSNHGAVKSEWDGKKYS